MGKAIAEEFLIEGANVVVCDIRKDLVDDFKEKVSAGYPECTLPVECDITKDAELDKMFEQAEKMFKTIDIVVNCAGVMDKFDPIVSRVGFLGHIDRLVWLLTEPYTYSGRFRAIYVGQGDGRQSDGACYGYETSDSFHEQD